MERDTPLADTLREEARELLDETVTLRRELHRWPELGNDLPVTRETVLGALDGLPLNVTLHETTVPASTGLGVAVGPAVILGACSGVKFDLEASTVLLSKPWLARDPFGVGSWSNGAAGFAASMDGLVTVSSTHVPVLGFHRPAWLLRW